MSSHSTLHRAILLAGLSLLAAGCRRDPAERKTYHLKTAQLAYDASQYKAAVASYQRVLRLDPKDTTALAQIGRCHFHLGALAEAEGFLDRCKEINPDLLDVRLSLGTLYLVRGRLALAHAEALYVVTRKPGNLEALTLLVDSVTTRGEAEDTERRLRAAGDALGRQTVYQIDLGKVYIRLKDWYRGERALRNALEIDPDSTAAQLTLGQLYLAKHEPPKAEKAIETATAMALTGSEADIQLAAHYLLQGRRDLARRVLEQLAQRMPAALPPQRMLAAIAFDEKRYPDAESAIDLVLERKPLDHFGLLLAGRLGLARGQTAPALARFGQLAALEPDSAVPHYEMAKAHIQARDYPAASRELSEALRLAPDYHEAGLLLAAVHLQTDTTATAIDDLEELVGRNPDLPRAGELLGAAYLKAGDPAQAAATYRRMLERSPGSPRAAYLAGIALLAAGDVAQATGMFETALAWHASYAPALNQLVAIDARASGWEAAIERVRRQIELVPDAAELHLLLGKALLASGQAAAGEAELCHAIELAPGLLAARQALGERLAAAGRYRQALELLEPVLAARPRDHDLLVLCGSLAERSDRLWDAETWYEKALLVDPGSAAAANNLAYLIGEHGGDRAHALKLARQAVAAAPQDPRFLDTLGWLLYRDGDLESALSTLLGVAEKLPRSGAVLCHLGLVQYRLGQREVARATLARALALGTDARAGDECRRASAELSN